MNEMCDDINPEAFKKIEQIEVPNFKIKLKNIKLKVSTLSNETNGNIFERSSTLRVFRAEIWLTVYRSIYIRMQGDIDSYLSLRLYGHLLAL